MFHLCIDKMVSVCVEKANSYSNQLRINGWAFEDNQAVEAVVYFNNKRSKCSFLRKERNDIFDIFNTQNALNSGFVLTVEDYNINSNVVKIVFYNKEYNVIHIQEINTNKYFEYNKPIDLLLSLNVTTHNNQDLIEKFKDELVIGNKKRILLVSHEFNLTGAPIAILNMAKILVELGHFPVVISNKKGELIDCLLNENITTIYAPQLHEDLQFSNWCIDLFDLVIANTIVEYPIINKLSGKEIPVLWWIHESLELYSPQRVIKMPKFVDDNINVFCVGNYAKLIFNKYFPNINSEILLYYSPEWDCNINGKHIIKKDLIINKTVFATIGTIESRKGYKVLLDAINYLSEEEFLKCFFVFVGKNCNNEVYEKIIDFTKKYPKNSIYISSLEYEDMYKLYAHVDCLICPSLDDPMPIVVTEALMLSKIVICSENTGSASIIKENNSGILYKNNDYKLLTKSIKKVINTVDINQIKNNARLTYEKYFCEDIFRCNLKNVLSQMSIKSLSSYEITVSIVIPTFNAGEEFSDLLMILNNQTQLDKLQIVVVDSGSKDDTVKIAKEKGAKLIEITQEEFTHSYARNIGAKNSDGNYVLFMTQDTMIDKLNWIYSMLKPIIFDDVIAVSCKEKPRLDCDLLGALNIFDHNRYLGIENQDRILSLPQTQNYETLRKNAQLNDVACLIVKDIFLEFGHQGSYAEDLNLGIRLIKSGYKLALLSSTYVIHSHTRPAFYHLKRTVVDYVNLKIILPDLPIEYVTKVQLRNRILTLYSIVLYYIEFTSNQIENDDIFFDLFEKEYLIIIEKVQSLSLKEINILFENDNEFIDKNLKGFIYKILELDNIEFEVDLTLSGHMLYYINVNFKEYLSILNLNIDTKIKKDLSDMLIKRTGILIGIDLSSYMINNKNINDDLTQLINDLRKGI